MINSACSVSLAEAIDNKPRAPLQLVGSRSSIERSIHTSTCIHMATRNEAPQKRMLDSGRMLHAARPGVVTLLLGRSVSASHSKSSQTLFYFSPSTGTRHIGVLPGRPTYLPLAAWLRLLEAASPRLVGSRAGPTRNWRAAVTRCAQVKPRRPRSGRGAGQSSSAFARWRRRQNRVP